ncbi:MAG: Lrp/AsnC family transcriptional regulator [Candidatus Freyarchaeota archaeon]|nr:Lrp/AsnC ligand binding domain-containing protein [Candidatus Freyrarchaeum guaymaensis]HDO80747.1 Lrp/AsnC family transcriptional regulator [Candidatus Bathyarchaeota archaeon]
MISAFVMIKIERGEDINWISMVKEVLQKAPGVKEVHAVFGSCDFIVKVEAENFQQLSNIIIEKIRGAPGVTSTETFITLPFDE